MNKDDLKQLSEKELEEKKNQLRKMLEELETEERSRGEGAGKKEISGQAAPGGNTAEADRADTLSGAGENAADRREKRRREKKKNRARAVRRIKMLLGSLLVIALLCGGFLVWRKYAPSTEHMEPKAYFEYMMQSAAALEKEDTGENEENAEPEDFSLQEGELAVVMQDYVESRKAVIDDGALYLNYEMVRELLNDRFYWDSENDCMLYTTALNLYEIPVGSRTYSVDGEDKTYKENILIRNNEEMMISADYLQEYTNVEYIRSPEENHVTVQYRWGDQSVAAVKKDAALRLAGDIKSPIVRDLKAEDSVCVLGEAGKWRQVVTEDGYVGYVLSRKLTGPDTVTVERDFEEQTYSSLTSDETVNLLWQMIDSDAENDNLQYVIKRTRGVNVISPTWFQITSDNGDYESYASAAYVKKAHRAGMQVWGLVHNIRDGFSSTTLLGSTKARNNLENKLIEEALEVGLDGINVDLEAIAYEARYSYMQFMREMSILCRKNNLVLSVDVPVPMSFNLYYDRTELGQITDYVIIMGYDEHYAGSEAGSVASLKFEENGITETLKEVPAEKIISGIPFYSRLWFTQTNSDGSSSVWSEIHDMDVLLKTIESYGAEKKWDSELGQYYAEWELDNGIFCQIWLEDEESVALKAGLVREYGLGGIAEWVFSFQRDTVWEIIAQEIGLELPQEAETEEITEAETEEATEAETEEITEAETHKKTETDKETGIKEKKTAVQTETDKAEQTEKSAGKAAETENETETETEAKRETASGNNGKKSG